MEDFDQVQISIKQAHVYKVPPTAGAQGFMCANWPPENCIFTGRLKIVTRGSSLRIVLEDPTNDKVFSEIPIEYVGAEPQIERAADSSRYYVIKLRKGGSLVLCGVGFDRREDAFDFNVQLRDHGSFLVRQDAPSVSLAAQLGPDAMAAVRGQEGQKIGMRFGAPRKTQQIAPQARPSGFAPPPAWNPPQ
eukprot:gnl/Chilomastix_caulleri/458.p1 GENE.gnl/Chilomastix_caulleri/458~~gnl/Chilomastix_caulleri/458.p1  ORF type:complete len:216 (+),score=49.55 gnl/Chilomastix_caulleri/458:80-649(+)